MLTNSETLDLKLRVLWVTQNWNSSQGIGHKCCCFIISFVHIISYNTFQHVTVAWYFIFCQSLNYLPCSKVVHGNGVNFKNFWWLILKYLSTRLWYDVISTEDGHSFTVFQVLRNLASSWRRLIDNVIMSQTCNV